MNSKKKLVWKDESERAVIKSVIIGHFGMWAIRQSPYLYPDNLDKGIKEFDNTISEVVSFNNVTEDYLTTYNELKENICTAISKINTILSSIDLDALARNIAQSVWLELCYDNEPSSIPYPERIEDTKDCEYDCNEEECITTFCPRYGKCMFTRDE